jgi:hypothetical protein
MFKEPLPSNRSVRQNIFAWSLHMKLSEEKFMPVSHFPAHSTCHTHVIFLHLNLLSEQYKLRCS